LEVFNAVGGSIAVVTVRESQIEPLTANELLHVRPLASFPCLADTTNDEKEPEMARPLDTVRPRHLAAWRSSFAWSGCGDSQPDS
jgi:hypothetical protein